MYGFFDDTDSCLRVANMYDYEKIVFLYTEEAIFFHTIGYVPQEGQFTTNPFREDKNPGAFWSKHPRTGFLTLSDLGTKEVKFNVPLFKFDCIGAVMLKNEISNLPEAVKWVVDNVPLPEGKTLTVKDLVKRPLAPIDYTPPLIEYRPRDFELRDKRFWFDRYGISRSDLLEDNVVPIFSYAIKTYRRDKPVIIRSSTPMYAINLPSGNVKIYNPMSEDKKKRFITNANENDIGGYLATPHTGDLVITKSYKDYRVLRNAGVNNVLWFQNEGCVPQSLNETVQGYQRVVFLYDNDRQGMYSSYMLVDKLKGYRLAEALWIPIDENKPSIKDSSDLVYMKGPKALTKFLKENALI